MTNKWLTYSGKIPVAVSLAEVCPSTNLEDLFSRYLVGGNPKSEIIKCLESEVSQMDSFADMILFHYGGLESHEKVPIYDSKGKLRENSVRYNLENDLLPFTDFITDIKSFDSLHGKILSSLLMTEKAYQSRERSGKISSKDISGDYLVTKVKDYLRATFVVPDRDIKAIDRVVDDLSKLGSTASKLGMKFIFPNSCEIKDYTQRPKQNGYGKYGVKQFPIYFSNKFNEPLRTIEVQIKTQEQAFREKSDGYHADFKKELKMDPSLYEFSKAA